MKRSLPFIIIGAVLVLAIGIGWRMSTRYGAGEQPATPNLIAPPIVKTTPPSAAVKPPPTGRVVTIEEFGDYQCPPCGLLHPELKKIEAEYGSSVHVVFH